MTVQPVACLAGGVIRIAVLGAAHPHVWYALDEIEADAGRATTLLGVQDRDLDLAQRCADPFDAIATTDRTALLELGPDLVVVAGQYHDRGSDVIAALSAGADVLADKPLCTDLDELAEIERVAAATGSTVSLLLEKRGSPETRAARTLVDRGDLGEIVAITSAAPHKLNQAQRPQWFLDPARYGGILGDLAVHDLDLALQFAPADSAEVRGVTGAAIDSGFQRYGVATVHTAATIITAEVSWLTPQASAVHGDYRMQLVGTEATADLFWARSELWLTSHRHERHAIELPATRRPAEDAFAAAIALAPQPIDTATSIAASRLALLAELSARSASHPQQWQRAVASVPTPSAARTAGGQS